MHSHTNQPALSHCNLQRPRSIHCSLGRLFHITSEDPKVNLHNYSRKRDTRVTQSQASLGLRISIMRQIESYADLVLSSCSPHFDASLPITIQETLCIGYGNTGYRARARSKGVCLPRSRNSDGQIMHVLCAETSRLCGCFGSSGLWCRSSNSIQYKDCQVSFHQGLAKTFFTTYILDICIGSVRAQVSFDNNLIVNNFPRVVKGNDILPVCNYQSVCCSCGRILRLGWYSSNSKRKVPWYNP